MIKKIIKPHITKPFNSNKKYSESDIFKMFNFLIDNIFVVFDSCVFQQRVSIPIGSNCAPILADLVLQYLYETDFIKGLSWERRRN
jgi:hypothetical protein